MIEIDIDGIEQDVVKVYGIMDLKLLNGFDGNFLGTVTRIAHKVENQE